MKTEIFQSTLPRGERLPDAGVRSLTSDISIHAPTRGATASSIQYLDLGSISIHAPTRGATRKQVRPLLEPRDFNPRSHEGSDLFQLLTSQGLLYFNPRSHEGSDIDEAQLLFNSRISIHAPTRGATCLCLDKYRLIHISIHAPTRGATTGSGNLFGDSIISIHAPTRGATPMLQLRYSRKPISIHAPTRGATESSSQHTLY